MSDHTPSGVWPYTPSELLHSAAVFRLRFGNGLISPQPGVHAYNPSRHRAPGIAITALLATRAKARLIMPRCREWEYNEEKIGVLNTKMQLQYYGWSFNCSSSGCSTTRPQAAVRKSRFAAARRTWRLMAMGGCSAHVAVHTYTALSCAQSYALELRTAIPQPRAPYTTSAAAQSTQRHTEVFVQPPPKGTVNFLGR